ncbi:TetR/AcrR family transcriptional regulator [Nocardioides bruguierae]|uniref:TetR/AcrR family transcriptional regulator n=1 Tax=Nocardioides bruguierae TaxID=2945102 RepID=A0A9X2D8N6_9ACTN|nr:TetR/AcrR family transcriptional regulator [Nocardioides bruguierae]MCL8026924.1 TetR/AcrR family transcriptional regulator [Nocardioides bruguierae]MCM0621371.1 TetR/AcrR family transcriptional regulator [Nocardioides bruguierae]
MTIAPRRTRREEIIEIAARVFAKTGFRATSLAEVAAEVGVSQPGLLHHFKTKDALILAVLQQRDAEDEEWMAGALDPDDVTLETWVRVIAERNLGQPGLVRLFTLTAAESLDADHPAHEYFSQRHLHSRAALTAIVRRDQEAGRVHTDLDPEVVAIEVLAMMNGLQLFWLSAGDVDLVGLLMAHVRRYRTGAA